MRSEYLIVLGLCLLITLPLELILGARVYRRPLMVLAAMAPMLVVFLAWDYLGIHREHWWYNAEKVTGIQLPGELPIEELLFFLVIPLCALLTFEAIGAMTARIRRLLARRRSADGQEPSSPEVAATAHRTEDPDA